MFNYRLIGQIFGGCYAYMGYCIIGLKPEWHFYGFVYYVCGIYYLHFVNDDNISYRTSFIIYIYGLRLLSYLPVEPPYYERWFLIFSLWPL